MSSLILWICGQSKSKCAGGYRNYHRLIKKFIKNGIWKSLSKDISITEIHALNDTYNIPKSTIRSWNKMLMNNSKWIPNHERKPQFPQEVENVIVEIIIEVIDSRSLPISNKTVKRLACAYMQNIIDSLTQTTAYPIWHSIIIQCICQLVKTF